MCGRYTLRRVDLARAAFGVLPHLPFDEFTERPRFNIAPTQDVPIIRLDSKNQPELSLARWGLIPSWTRGKPKQQPINARAETVATSGMFRQAFERRRCLVLADGFYEWQKLGEKKKQPMFMHHRDHSMFAFAGIWERWKPDETSEPIDTMTIHTTSPNDLMKPIHDRMPVVLKPKDYSRWLDREKPGNDVVDLLIPYDGDEFVAEPVSTTVNSPRNDDESCVAPVVVE